MNRLLMLSLALSVAACDPTPPVDDAGAQDAGAQDAGSDLCDPVELPCEDQIIQQLSLHDWVSTGAVTTTEAGGVFTTVVDATAGGTSGGAINYPFVYLKFTDQGAIKVDIDDEAALLSQDWDLAARRFIVRLNSGDSGPSCVAAVESSATFDSITAAPAASAFAVEDFYSATCDYVTDSRFAGFDGPDSLLKTFWEMSGMCVATTGLPFVLRLADRRHLKLVIDAYYATGQEGCNTGGTAGTAGGTLTLRWAWLS